MQTPPNRNIPRIPPRNPRISASRPCRKATKPAKVAEVFHSVAQRYDIMNDFMSAGLHRVWKAFTIGRAAIRPGMKVLDIAGGTGDLARASPNAPVRTGKSG